MYTGESEGISVTNGENTLALKMKKAKTSPEGTGIAELPSAAGTYYLMQDITISSTWSVPSGETTLDLNGYGITMTGGGSKSFSGGYITGGNSTGNGGSISYNKTSDDAGGVHTYALGVSIGTDWIELTISGSVRIENNHTNGTWDDCYNAGDGVLVDGAGVKLVLSESRHRRSFDSCRSHRRVNADALRVHRQHNHELQRREQIHER